MSTSNGTRLSNREALHQTSQHLIETSRRRESEWDVEPDNRYSPEQFYTRASDAQGHKEHVRVNIPPYIAAQVTALVQSGKFPYQTMADVLRDALYHRLHHLSTKRDTAGLSAVVGRYRRECRTADYLEEMRSVDDLREAVLKIVDQALDKRDYAGCRYELDSLMEDVGEYREPFKSDMKKLLKECYIRLGKAEKVDR